MEIRHAQRNDLPAMLEIYREARAFMKANGNPNQWKDNRPSAEAIQKDIESGQSYLIFDGGVLCGAFSLIFGDDPTYALIENGQWKSDLPYATIHKIASFPGTHGVFSEIIRFSEPKAQSLRIDTHPDNQIMQHLILKNGFEYCGNIYTDDGTLRYAYQKDLIKQN